MEDDSVFIYLCFQCINVISDLLSLRQEIFNYRLFLKHHSLWHRNPDHYRVIVIPLLWEWVIIFTGNSRGLLSPLL